MITLQSMAVRNVLVNGALCDDFVYFAYIVASELYLVSGLN